MGVGVNSIRPCREKRNGNFDRGQGGGFGLQGGRPFPREKNPFKADGVASRGTEVLGGSRERKNECAEVQKKNGGRGVIGGAKSAQETSARKG